MNLKKTTAFVSDPLSLLVHSYFKVILVLHFSLLSDVFFLNQRVIHHIVYDFLILY